MSIAPIVALTSRVDARNWAGVADKAKQHGFGGIDWNLDYFRIPAAANARAKFYAAARSSGLPSGFHGPCQDIELGHADPVVSTAARAYLKMYIDFLSHFGGTHMTVHLGSRSIPMADLSWDNAVDGLRATVEYGRARGVNVCLENLKQGWTSDPARLLALAEASGARLTFDVGHARGSALVREGRASLESCMRQLLHRIDNLHVYDIETLEGTHMEPTSLENIRPALDLALGAGITWWVVELDSLDAIVRVKSIIDAEFSS